MKTLVASFVLLTCLLGSMSQSQTWKFFGPDSPTWRNIIQMDVSFRNAMPPRVGAATANGIAVHFGTQWRYPCGNFTTVNPPDIYYYWFRSIHFSPWDDSVAFLGFDELTIEASSGAVRADNLFGEWQYGIGGLRLMGCAWKFSPYFSFVFPSRDSGKVYAWICGLSKSENNGLTWDHYGNWSESLGFFLTLDFLRDSLLYEGGRPVGQDSIGVYKTSDEGSTWVCVYTLASSYTKADFLAQGDTLVLATSKTPASGDATCGIFRSSDQGNSWSQVLSSVNVAALARDDGNPSVMFAASDRGAYQSVDAGATWRMYNNTLPTFDLVGIKKDPYSDTLYVATQDSGIYKVFGLAVRVPDEIQLPRQYALEQNYPNPFNPATEIRFEIPESRFVSLEVFDVLGRQVSALVNEWKLPGRYSATWNAARFASGVYFYRMQAGDFVETKKLLLLR